MLKKKGTPENITHILYSKPKKKKKKDTDKKGSK